jgi:hypothetical protein
MTHLKNRVLRAAAALAAGAGLAISAAGSAHAAPVTPVSGPDLAAASVAAHSAQAARLLDKVAGRIAQRSGTTPAVAALVVQQQAVPVYALNSAFVRTGTGDVASLWYVATTATKGSAVMTVFTAPDPATGAWQPVNVATGDTEARMAQAAHGAALFTEPQIGAWYALSGDRIRALNASAIKAVGRAPVTIASYGKQVANRYADKQPGSAYAARGTAGGYDVTGAAVSPVPAGSESSGVEWLVLVSGAGVAAVLCGGALILRRRRRALV